jgi:lipid-A-disaccharide synthase-like uncharacterized protein
MEMWQWNPFVQLIYANKNIRKTMPVLYWEIESFTKKGEFCILPSSLIHLLIQEALLSTCHMNDSNLDAGS